MEKKKVALITGGSSGIGKQIAIELASQGITVCINYGHSDEKAEAVKKEIEEKGGEAVLYKADITKEEEVKALFEKIKEEQGSLDVLVNNAGIDIISSIEEYNYEDWQKVMQLNLDAKFLCTKYAILLLKKSDYPSIINIATRFGTKPLPEASAYSCAAAGIVMMTKVAALELAPYNIRVNTVSPGLTKTPLTEPICTEEEFEGYAKNNPRHRVGKTEDIAHVVAFLASEKADFINGENINVSGGDLLK